MLLTISHCGLLALNLLLIDSPTPPELPPLAPHERFTPDERSHWAYQVPSRPTPPVVKETGWIRNPIDRFLLAGLESAGLGHAPEADRAPSCAASRST